MAEIILARLDDRLIHGQVAITILQGSKCKKVVVIDDTLVNDSMQKVVLQAVCPRGINFELISTQEAGDRYIKDQLGKKGPIVVLFKDVKNIYHAFQAGLKYDQLQLGGQRDISEGRKYITGQIHLNVDEARMLKEISESGVNVYCQPTPQDTKTPLKQVIAKNFPELE